MRPETESRRMLRLQRAADWGSATAAEALALYLLDRRPPRRLHDARRYAEIAMDHPDPQQADHLAGRFLWGDGCGGWDRPADLGPDPAFALRLLRRLARRGNAHAMYSLSLASQRGAGVRQDWREAERWARRAARHGETEALNNLGVDLFYGHGVAQDRPRAARCYREASRLGDAHAAGNLALCLRWGDGVRKDPPAAFRFFRLAARRGHVRSELRLAEAWLDGEIVARNRRRGLALLRRMAADRRASGLPRRRSARLVLGERLLDGDGVPRDVPTGLRLLRGLADDGWAPAMRALGDWFHGRTDREPGDYRTAMTWYRRAAEAGESDALHTMALCHLDGHPPVVRRDVRRGIALLHRATANGSEEAMIALGERLLDGEGVRRDARRGLAWLEKAASEGHHDAAGLLAARFRDGRGLPRDPRKARSWARVARRWEVDVPSPSPKGSLRAGRAR